MGTKMKGLLRGLRYISNIFESDDKEPEMQIGFPTDVKHVAHIGWDGPSVNSPSWMYEFKSASSEPPTSTARGERNQAANSPRSPSQDNNVARSPRDLPVVPLPRPSRRNPSSSSSASATNPGSPRNREARHSRRHQSTSGATNSPDHDKSGGSRRRSTRERRSDIISSSSSTTMQDDEAAAEAEKKARRRKVKGSSASSSGSSTSSNKASRSKGVELPPLKPMSEDAGEE